MNMLRKPLLFFLLPLAALLIWPPEMLPKALPVIGMVALLLLAVAALQFRGKDGALTFAIFIQGMNIIVRVMMIFTNGFTQKGEPVWLYLLTNLAAIILSFWLVVRLDRQDIRNLMRR